jgi:tetratricopeptide (TPR) repeat protein
MILVSNARAMSPRTHRALFILVLSLFLDSVALPQIPGNRQYAISGSVQKEGSDAPLADARVQLFDALGNLVHPMLVTNARGEFSFGEFRPGEYQILADHDGFQQARVAVDITRHDESSVVIRLREFSAVDSPGGAAVTAHELGVPKKARDAFDRGLSKLHDKSDYKGAIEQFQRAIDIDPNYYEAYAEIGIAQVRLKNFSAAEAVLRRSVALSSSKYAPPLLLLSVVLNDQNRSADAEPIARQAVAAEPKAWRANYELARALLGLRRLPEAEASAYAARRLKPENPVVYLLLSEIHRHTRNAKALMEDFDAYLRLAPQGQAAPEVRKLREQLVVFLETQSKSETIP